MPCTHPLDPAAPYAPTREYMTLQLPPGLLTPGSWDPVHMCGHPGWSGNVLLRC